MDEPAEGRTLIIDVRSSDNKVMSCTKDICVNYYSDILLGPLNNDPLSSVQMLCGFTCERIQIYAEAEQAIHVRPEILRCNNKLFRMKYLPENPRCQDIG